MPNIDYANINIGIQQFQDISTGEINAGEVRLRNENSLDMINTHAHKRGSNKTSLSHREVLAIKNAFMRSLSESGVGAEEINRVRQEPGLAPRQPVDRSLLDRSIKPLSRQQIREILDHNADTINANVDPGTVVTRELVGKGPDVHLDVEKEHIQFKRDLKNYRYHFPGCKEHTRDYNEVRDRFVRFLTGRRNATFAGASPAVKKRVVILMSLATQYTVSLGQNAIATSMARPGENPMIFAIPVLGGPGPDLRFAKDPAGNIRLTVTQSTNAQMVIDNRDPQHPVHHHMPAGSTFKFQVTITLPADNLAELAEADWTHYDRKTVNDFDGTMDDRVALIPEPCRFKGTVDFLFHLDEAPANAPAQACPPWGRRRPACETAPGTLTAIDCNRPKRPRSVLSPPCLCASV